MTPRFKTAAIATVVVGALAGPSVTGAAASTHAHAAKGVALTRSERRELKTLKTLKTLKALKALNASRATTADPPTGPALAIDDAIQNLEFDLSAQGVQALLGDFPLVGDYG